ncbi:hypothetical protein NHX12_009474, partial [Muraenolepis orangiensis]
TRGNPVNNPSVKTVKITAHIVQRANVPPSFASIDGKKAEIFTEASGEDAMLQLGREVTAGRQEQITWRNTENENRM